MASATHRHRQLLALAKIERSRDVGGAGTAHDQRRMPIECRILDQARRFIVARIWCDHMAGYLGRELSDYCRIELTRTLFAGFQDAPRFGKHFSWASAKRCRGERGLLDKLSSSTERHDRCEATPLGARRQFHAALASLISESK